MNEESFNLSMRKFLKMVGVIGGTKLKRKVDAIIAETGRN